MQLIATSRKRSRKRRGVFTFEWILLISLLVIGVIGGLTAVRNSLICELNDLTDCIEQISCCDDDGLPAPGPDVMDFGQGAQAGCSTCSVGGSSSNSWWDGYGSF